MVWGKQLKTKVSMALSMIMMISALVSCAVAVTFNGASIDYTKVKTISINDFPNQAPLVYAPLAAVFTEQVKDVYVRQTRLKFARQNGDMHLEGEITGYDLSPQAVKEDAFASQTRLKITVRVRFTNNTNTKDNFEKVYSAFRDFSNDKILDQVQDELCKQIVEEIADQIYNDTVAKW